VVFERLARHVRGESIMGIREIRQCEGHLAYSSGLGLERVKKVGTGGFQHHVGAVTLVSRFRRSYHLAARAPTNVGTKGTLATI